jgi:hypothetical protein
VKYIYIGNKEQLIEHGFTIYGNNRAWRYTDLMVYDNRYDDYQRPQSIGIYHEDKSIIKSVKYIENQIIWNDVTEIAYIKPYIQDLIDNGLVKIKK